MTSELFSNRYFAEVILPLSLAQTFTYEVSETEFHFIKIGMRVAVPFGKSKIYTGLICDLHQNKPQLYEAKEIHQILDNEPIATSIQIKHWFWIASYYMCGIGDVFRAAFPSALLLASETTIVQKPVVNIQENDLTDDEYLIFQALQQQSSLTLNDVIGILNKKTIFPIIQKLINKNVIIVQEELQESYKPKLVKYVRLSEKYTIDDGLQLLLEQLKKSEKQRTVVLTFFQLSAIEKKPISIRQLTEKSAQSSAVLKALIDKEIFEEYYVQTDRIHFDGQKNCNELTLSAAQQEALKSIQTQFKKKEVCLLHGVTAAGKTEVYIKLIENYINEEKQVLYLLPEIALTTQLVGRLQKHFGNQIAVFHSKYSNNERVEVWNNVLQNNESAQIIIGARSALFLPFSNLGFIIVDEEHEQTFKQQDPAPRYHARDAAIVLANLFNAKVLLGSATPSLETFYNAKNDKFGLVTITERYGSVQMPNIEVVDLKDKFFRKQMTGHFSDLLINEIAKTLALNEQVILFQNRRGYSPVVECITCGHVPQCPQCDVSLTYHQFKNQLRCHYCGYAMGNPKSCHACSSPHLTTKGFGTEQVQQELIALFPNAKIGRMDQDTTKGKYGFERIIDSFKNREIDIMVGTQMLAKGLDFDNVTLVGIMNADNLLYHPDFRAFERSFQLMTQVAGRSGRKDKQGKVMIQTYNIDHHIINQVVNNNYALMFEEQLHQRKIYAYPPFYRLIKLTLKHKDYQKLQEASIWLHNVLFTNLQMPVLGPEEPPINRIRNEYIKTIMIKIPINVNLMQTKKTVSKILKSFEAVSQYRSVRTVVTVDYY